MSKTLTAKERRANQVKKFFKDTDNIGKKYSKAQKENLQLRIKKDITRFCDAVLNGDSKGFGVIYLNSDDRKEIERIKQDEINKGNVTELLTKIVKMLEKSKNWEKSEGTELEKACKENPELQSYLKRLRKFFKQSQSESEEYDRIKEREKGSKGKEKLVSLAARKAFIERGLKQIGYLNEKKTERKIVRSR